MDSPSLKRDFTNNGFAMIPQLLPPRTIKILREQIAEQIQQCSAQLDCSLADYLYSASRWVHPSPVTIQVLTHIEVRLKKFVENLFNETVELIKVNVICKSAYAKAAIPCHQDAAYASKETLYEFSIWLALNDVPLNAGHLEFLPGSHQGEIQAAVDFWQPDFIDQAFQNYAWEKQAIAAPLQAGDGILFDSRIWHRSAENEKGQDRYAIVTRWKRKRLSTLPYTIPPRVSDGFGMWSCGDITKQLLQKGLVAWNNHHLPLDLCQLIPAWQKNLRNSTQPLPFHCEIEATQNALKALHILHEANMLHNGGDAQGVIYPQLWHTLLRPLSDWLTKDHA